MSKASVNKSVVGRQSQLPLGRAFRISLNSLKIRFWRSMVTAGGIFLGIAFLATVLTQWLMQWPLPTKIDAGFIRMDGQIRGPGDYEVYKPIPKSEGLAAGIPEPVINRTLFKDGKFSLTAVVQGQYLEARAKKNLARVNKEWEGLKQFEKPLPVWVDVLGDKDITIANAVMAGVPEKVAKKLAGKGQTFKGSALVEILREQPKWVKPLYYATSLDQDISVNDAVKAGVPKAIALHLAGTGRAFKGSALNDAIKAHPTWIAIWTSRVKRYAIYNEADAAGIKKLANTYAVSLQEALKEAKNPDGKTADISNIMIVNPDGRRTKINMAANEAIAASTKLQNGDYILIPDRNGKYRMWWLVAMSLLVCAVGITNSMLMAVTERFKEIGTMKCLGALDSFVVTLFMLESGMLGICASVLGWLLGFIAMILVAGFTKGWDIVATIGILDILGTFVISVGIGMFLTICATIAPALRAANMPAAMALRSEI